MKPASFLTAMLKDYIIKMIDKLTEILNSFWGWILLILCQFFSIDGVHFGLLFLLLAFILDYITGLSAAWKERNPDSGAPFFFESSKMRHSLLKACTYLMFIFMSWVMWYLFFDGTVHLPISTKEINIISITIGICIAIEFWSVLENCKRMGYDIVGKMAKLFSEFWKNYRHITRGR